MWYIAARNKNTSEAGKASKRVADVGANTVPAKRGVCFTCVVVYQCQGVNVASVFHCTMLC